MFQREKTETIRKMDVGGFVYRKWKKHRATNKEVVKWLGAARESMILLQNNFPNIRILGSRDYSR